MRHETQFGPKTQLGTYIGHLHNFCFDSLGNTSQSQPLPKSYPGLAAMSKCGKTAENLKTREPG